jgi:hypothetical protein
VARRATRQAAIIITRRPWTFMKRR